MFSECRPWIPAALPLKKSEKEHENVAGDGSIQGYCVVYRRRCFVLNMCSMLALQLHREC